MIYVPWCGVVKRAVADELEQWPTASTPFVCVTINPPAAALPDGIVVRQAPMGLRFVRKDSCADSCACPKDPANCQAGPIRQDDGVDCPRYNYNGVRRCISAWTRSDPRRARRGHARRIRQASCSFDFFMMPGSRCSIEPKFPLSDVDVK